MRYDLKIKNRETFLQICNWIEKQNILRINIANTDSKDQNLFYTKALLAKFPKLKICLHYSIQNNYIKDASASYSRFLDFFKQIKGFEVLLISGGQKRKLDSLKVLQSLKENNLSHNKFYVAYNPYLSLQNQQIENFRLQQKLETGLVKGIYLQIGINKKSLLEGLKFIKNLNPNIEILGCLIEISKINLARLSYRKPNGVFLSNEFLNSLKLAKQANEEILDIYSQNKIEPLWEYVSVVG
jgi:hypothetical protein